MIIEIPDPEDYAESAINYLNLAWGIGVSLLELMDDSQISEWGEGRDISEFWKVSQPTLGNAFAMIQQAQEIALKGRIVSVSPFLLIQGDPRDWPKKSADRDVPFSEFRTINASDLIKTHDSVCATKLSDTFASLFDDVRRKRNVIMHQAKSDDRLEAIDILIHTLETLDHLFPDCYWPKIRRTYLDTDPASALFSNDHVGGRIVYEINLALDNLKPKEVKRFFGISKKQRRYLCPHCYFDMGKFPEAVPLAHLNPNTSTSTTVSCFLCQKDTKVKRVTCSDNDCKSNVIATDPEIGMCLVCLADG